MRKEVREIAVLAGHTGPVLQASFAPDNSYIVTASQDHTAKIWNFEGELQQTLDGHFAPIPLHEHWDQWDEDQKQRQIERENEQDRETQAIKKICISPDGTHILLLAELGNPSLWKIDKSTLQAQRIAFIGKPWKGERFTDAVFFPQGDCFITSSWDHSLRIWDLNGNQIRRLSGHTDYVTSVNINQDGSLIFSTSWDKTARIWTQEGDLITILRGPSQQQEGAIALDGSYAFSVIGGSEGILWPMPQTVYKWLTENSSALPKLNEKDIMRFSNILGSQEEQREITAHFRKGEVPS